MDTYGLVIVSWMLCTACAAKCSGKKVTSYDVCCNWSDCFYDLENNYVLLCTTMCCQHSATLVASMMLARGGFIVSAMWDIGYCMGFIRFLRRSLWMMFADCLGIAPMVLCMP